MKITINEITSLSDSNRFLRSLWAELRRQFGKFGWNYQPLKDGSSQTIFLGWGGGIPIFLSYSQTSIVNGIHFGEDFGESIDESSKLGQQLKQAVDAVLQNRHHPEIKKFRSSNFFFILFNSSLQRPVV